VERSFPEPIDLTGRGALGVWIKGDGQGQVLNVQVRSPAHLYGGVGDRYIVVDFTGWRYFALVEPEGPRHADFSWPYGDIYTVYRNLVHFDRIASVSLWYNDIPPGATVSCDVAIRAIPLAESALRHPSITIGGRTIALPVELTTGSVAEVDPGGLCRVFGPNGEQSREVRIEGGMPVLETGAHEARLRGRADGSTRVRITTFFEGDPLAEGER
jgi:hypothetical protein